MQNYLKLIFVWGLIFWSTLTFAHTLSTGGPNLDSLTTPIDWFNLDPQENGVMGTSANKAYELLLNGKQPKRKVVVAVIDSGVDIEHEDLQGKIWVNTKEIPGNGVDDDKNGFKDDVNGWNFIGGSDGSNIGADSYELTREYARLKPIYGELDPNKVKRRHQKEYAYWLGIQEEFDETKEEAELNHQFFTSLYDNFSSVAEILKTALGKKDIKSEDLIGLESEDEAVTMAAAMVGQLFAQMGEESTSLNEILEFLEGEVVRYSDQIEFSYNPEFDPRHIVGDDPSNYKERNYGNQDVIGPDANHGTHVAGIIAADRNNSLGMRGISEHAVIMPIRAIPNGDERDKDVANAIYYAVDNGADIINMSFGKSFSPGKKQVDKAVKYANRKGVLLIHAAGNSGEEVNSTNNFPNKWLGKKKIAPNWIEVGASAWQGDEHLPGNFSNYGEKVVDLFAPGVDVYSTIPGNDYEANSGTSMAAPIVSGVTAIIMAYYPDLEPSEVRKILQQSVYQQGDQMVIRPGKEEEEVVFGSLSIAGGVVNAYQALKLAESLAK